MAITNCRLDLKDSYLTRFFAFNHKENNWVQTIPETGWNRILRLYGPLEPWFDKTWRPGEIELLK